MNENIDLTKILKDCPKGWEFYSLLYGEVEFISIDSKNGYYQIVLREQKYYSVTFVDSKGKYFHERDGECTLFPSKEQRDWSKFTAPWYKKEKFDQKTLKPFDKVLVRDFNKDDAWNCELFSYIIKSSTRYPYRCVVNAYAYCIPYNDDTKHLVGTAEEAPEYYRYWES